MRPLKSAFSIFALIVLTGCTTVQVSQDYDPQTDHSLSGTWHWRELVQPLTGDIRADNPLLDKRIRGAVENHLSSRRFTQDRDNPDLYLTYHLAIEQKILSDTVHTTVGVGSYYHPWYGGIGTETHIRQYDESRLTIDIHSAETGGLVWRGVGVYRFRTYQTPQDAAAAAQSTVDKILFQFPPGERQ